ncbi:MAG: hypothetical protein AAF561_15835 [Planctomycetota bacterium]
MTADVLDEARPLHATEKLAVVETDVFCSCGYNLHGQRTQVDERLGFVTVRCPECGKWHPANQYATSNSVWLRRFATFVLFCWVLALLLILLAATFATAGVAMGRTMEFTRSVQFDPANGRIVLEINTFEDLPISGRVQRYQYHYADDGSVVPPPPQTLDATPDFSRVVTVDADGQRWYPRMRVPVRQVPDEWYESRYAWQGPPPTWRSVLGFGGPMAFGGLVLGVIQAATMWHLGWPRKLLPAVTVVACATGLYLLFMTATGEFDGPVRTAVTTEAFLNIHAPLLVAWIVGLVIGRPVARFVVDLFVPPKPRQALAHLWFADGKTLSTS